MCIGVDVYELTSRYDLASFCNTCLHYLDFCILPFCINLDSRAMLFAASLILGIDEFAVAGLIYS